MYLHALIYLAAFPQSFAWGYASNASPYLSPNIVNMTKLGETFCVIHIEI